MRRWISDVPNSQLAFFLVWLGGEFALGLAATLVVVRAGALVLGARFGMAAGGVPREQRRFLPYSLFSQSGVAIGLAVLLAKHFAGWGEGASALLLGGIMTNELIGPVLFRAALMRSGEAGKAGKASGEPNAASPIAH